MAKRLHCSQRNVSTFHRFVTCFSRQNKAYGGALALCNIGALGLIHCFFTNNSAGGQGGAVWSTSKAHVLISSSLFENNTSSEGGAIFFCTGNLEVSVKNCMFISNIATIQGGALFANDTALVCVNSDFSGNRAPVAGAVLFKGEQILNITGSNISRTNCGMKGFHNLGGAIGADSSATVVLAQVTVCNNEIGGGLILLHARAEVSNSFFCNNSGSVGGAIVAAPQVSMLKIRNTSFVGNTGSLGSALFLNNPVTLIENCTFVGVVSFITPLIIVLSANNMVVQILSSLFTKSEYTSNQIQTVPIVLYFSASEGVNISVTLYVWKTMYKITTDRTTEVDKNLINNASINFVDVDVNVNFTSQVSLFASGKSDKLITGCLQLQQ